METSIVGIPRRLPYKTSSGRYGSARLVVQWRLKDRCVLLLRIRIVRHDFLAPLDPAAARAASAATSFTHHPAL